MSMEERKKDQILRGAGYIGLAVFLIASMNALAKWLGDTYHPVELVFYRNLIVFVCVCLYFQATRNFHLIRTERLKSHVIRAAVGNLSIFLAFTSVGLLPLADFTTLYFTSPLFVTALSVPMLKERVGPWRWAAVIIGFMGVLIVANPSGEGFQSPLGIASGLAFGLTAALVQIFLRDLGRTEDTRTTVFYFMAMGIPLTAVFLPFFWTGPKVTDLWLILALALTGGAQQILKTKGYSLGPVALLSPLNFTSLIWAAVFGLIIWDQVPGWNVWVGAAVIIASNVFILWRERQVKDGA